MYISKLTSHFQATIPQKVRKILKINKGDAVGFDVENEKVVLKKVSPMDVEYLKAVEHTLSEWGTQKDDELFKDL